DPVIITVEMLVTVIQVTPVHRCSGKDPGECPVDAVEYVCRVCWIKFDVYEVDVPIVIEKDDQRFDLVMDRSVMEVGQYPDHLTCTPVGFQWPVDFCTDWIFPSEMLHGRFIN